MRRPCFEMPDRYDVHSLRVVFAFLWSQSDRPFKLRIFLALLLITIASASAALAPVALAEAVDAIATPANAIAIAPIAILLGYGVVLSLSRALLQLRNLVAEPVMHRLHTTLSVATVTHLQSLGLRFHNDRHTGRISRTLDNGTRAAGQLVSSTLLVAVPLVAQLGFVVAVLLGRFDLIYALIIVATFFIYAAALIIGAEQVRVHQRTAVRTGTEAHGRVVDALLNYETVKYFGNDDYVVDRVARALKDTEHLLGRTSRMRSLTGLLQAVILGAGLTVVVLLAGRSAAAGEITVGGFVLLNTYLIQVLTPLEGVGNLYRMVKQALAELEQLTKLLREKPEVSTIDGTLPVPDGPGSVRFREVYFSYEPVRVILDGISFDVPAGSTTALVGPSGSGKSTIGRLIFRFYDPDAGTIELDGKEIMSLQTDGVRAAIGVVPQDTVLFNDSLYHNIAFGFPKCSRNDVERAVRTARLSDLVADLPEGIDTVVGERGLKLSGGERQRVSIARMILKRPTIYLFDEATSSLDAQTERAIMADLRAISQGSTTIVIAHRLSTVVYADQILVLEHGRIVERGSHSTLVESGHVYAKMWEDQQDTGAAATDLEGSSSSGGSTG